MIRNYLVLTFRNFLRNRNYTLINILGLSIGITSCIIIFLLLTYELGFDKFHGRYENIYRVVQNSQSASGDSRSASTPYPLANAFRNDFLEIPLVTQMHGQDDIQIAIDGEKMNIKNALFADSLFFDVFGFEVLSGNPHAELGQPGKVFLTKSLADKIMKGKQTATIRLDNNVDVEVAGIVQDPPANSHIKFSMVVSMSSFNGDFLGGLPLDQWTMTSGGFVYLVLPDKVRPAEVNMRLKDFVTKYYGNEDSKRRSFGLQPLREIHFNQDYIENPGDSANANYSDLVIMGVLGIFILVIACINFINLATALAMRKSKEIGIRKTLGARRRQLTAYFLGETFIITFMAVLISLCITEWSLGWLNNFLEKSLHIIGNPWLPAFLIVLTAFVTMLSGFYPAMILAGYNPAVVLKSKVVQGSSGAGVRKILVVFQFVIAQALIISTLIIAQQMQYFRSKPLGFSREEIINVPVQPKKDKLESLRARLEGHPGIKQITFALGAPTSDNNFSTNYYLTEKGKTEVHDISVKPVDRHYLETYGLKLKAGRWFTESDEKMADQNIPDSLQKHVYILNEAAARRLGFHTAEDIIGTNITTGVSNITAEVVGVVEDFHSASLHDNIRPLVLINFPFFYYDAGIKIDMANASETVSFVEKNWSDLFPDYYFEYEYLDEKLDSLYRQDERTFTLFKIFAGISIFIGCLGLYGLISFMANQKLKEIGVRKVLGASAGSIVFLFSREFIKLIGIAFFIATPVTWYLMQQWLDSFAYKVPMPWVVFGVGLVSTLVISLITVSYRSIRAAVANPAETLRTE